MRRLRTLTLDKERTVKRDITRTLIPGFASSSPYLVVSGVDSCDLELEPPFILKVPPKPVDTILTVSLVYTLVFLIGYQSTVKKKCI